MLSRLMLKIRRELLEPESSTFSTVTGREMVDLRFHPGISYHEESVIDFGVESSFASHRAQPNNAS